MKNQCKKRTASMLTAIMLLITVLGISLYPKKEVKAATIPLPTCRLI